MEIITIYFGNDLPVKILPMEHCGRHKTRYLVSDGLTFDLESTSDISSIPIPNYRELCGLPNIFHSLDYVLKRRAGNLSKNGLFSRSIVCLQETSQIMNQSPIHQKKKDYMDIVLEPVRVGRYEEVKKEKAFVEDSYLVGCNFSSIYETVLQKTLDSIHQQVTDLVEADDAPSCDEICAKYRKHIYSTSGKDKWFPTMTSEVYSSGLIFLPFIEGISRPKYCGLDNIIGYNNRPFTDDRTDGERENYKQLPKQRVFEERYAIDYFKYCQTCDFISLLQPKSFKSYQEMKYNNTENFQELMQVAEEAGIDIGLRIQKALGVTTPRAFHIDFSYQATPER